ncbi:AP2 domain transcription factor AP2IX-6 [Cardiosporidium cionae]|uniref:AP2 domain transcription factor AP2IX-6 n=1 Tax=Cardiosporidium cionae TaxID=476202 RepID=A0ABQ7J9A1_9APIC|nr:AP2 domain transcription factor AP2IX-6 [Cardiosporidium cionae]|eukprot:KAF8820582.1 AP2 domain transcription factor AP2IX-6 [Cardiosporidium cionae]
MAYVHLQRIALFGPQAVATSCHFNRFAYQCATNMSSLNLSKPYGSFSTHTRGILYTKATHGKFPRGNSHNAVLKLIPTIRRSMQAQSFLSNTAISFSQLANPLPSQIEAEHFLYKLGSDGHRYFQVLGGVQNRLLQSSGHIQQQRFFAGRSGGMKRKKTRHSPRVIQTGLGRRFEFFWPKKSRRLRIPMYANSRPNLVYDQHLKRWLVTWYRNGIQVFRPFSCKEGKFEVARKRALTLLKHLKGIKATRRLPAPDVNRSGVRGIYFDSDERLWVAVWNQAGIRRFKAFPVLQMGFDSAFRAAVAVRKQKVAENHQFVMQRSRWRSGRNALK